MDSWAVHGRVRTRAASWRFLEDSEPALCEHDVGVAIDAIVEEAGEFAGALFCYACWPGSARYDRKYVERLLLQLVLEQCKLRALQAMTAQLTHDIAVLDVTLSRRRPADSHQMMIAHRNAMEEAKARRWPAPSPVYQRLTLAVLDELRDRGGCHECVGAGRAAAARWASGACVACAGTPRRPRSDLSRAHALQLTWHAYAKAWKAPFEWALDHCEVAIHSVTTVLQRNLQITCAAGAPKPATPAPTRGTAGPRRERCTAGTGGHRTSSGKSP